MKPTLKLALPIAVVVAGALAAVVLVKAAPEAATQEPSVPPPLVRVIGVAPADVALDVTSQGDVQPRTEATLVAQVSGRIVEVAPSFAAGGAFGRGDVLVRIDPADYRLAVRQAEARVAQAETALAREQAEARVARQEWQALQDGGAGSGAGTPPAEPDPLVLHEPQLAEARATLESARAQLEQARLNLERTTVRAPFAGRVREKTADVGQSVTAGAALGRIFATDYAEVELPVPVAQLGYLDVDLTGAMDDGPAVTLGASLGGTRHTWPARIVRTAGAIEPRTRMLGLVARVDRPLDPARRRGSGATAASAAPLPMGLFVDATIAGRRAEGVYVLPRAAMREGARREEATSGATNPDGAPGDRTETASLDRPTGWVLVAEPSDGSSDAPGGSPDGGAEETARLRFRAVEILRRDGDRVIVSSGLAPGERVAISPLDTPVDGMAVRLTTVAGPDEDATAGEPAKVQG